MVLPCNTLLTICASRKLFFTHSSLATLQCVWGAAQERALEDAYLGDLGPILRATVGDTIQVTFLNRIERALTIHPHGVFYNKSNEGALYNDGTSGMSLCQPSLLS